MDVNGRTWPWSPAVLQGKATRALGQGSPCVGLLKIARPFFISGVLLFLRLVSVSFPAQGGEWGGLLFWQSSRKSCQRLTDHRSTDHRLKTLHGNRLHRRCNDVRVLSLALRGVLEDPKINCQSIAFLCNPCSFPPAKLSPAPNSLPSPQALRTFPLLQALLCASLSPSHPSHPLPGLLSSSQKDPIQLVSKGYMSTPIRHQSNKQIPKQAASEDESTL